MSAETDNKRESLTKGSIFSVSNHVWVTLVGYALNLFLARQLGPELFGFFGVIITIMMWLELTLAEGIPVWTVRLMAKDGSPRLPRTYLFIQLAVGLALMIVLLILASPLAALFGEPERANLFMIAAIDIPLFGLYTVLLAMLLGKQQYGRRLLTTFSYATGKLVVVVLLVVFGFGIHGAVVGNVASTVVGIIVGLTLIVSLWGYKGLTSRQKVGEDRKAAVRGSVAPAAFEVLRVLIITLDLWVVKATLPAATAGYYRSAQLIAVVPFFLASGLGTAFYGAFSDAYAKGDMEKCRHYISQATRLLITAGALWLAVVVPTAEDFLALLFSDPYEAGGVALMILSIGLVVAAPTDMVAAVLLVHKRYKLLVGAAAVLAIIEVGLVFWLVNAYAMTGVAIAVASVLIVGGLAGMLYLRTYQRVNPLLTLAKVTPAALVLGALMYWIHPEPGLRMVVVFALAPVVYALLLLPTGGLTMKDIRDVRNGLKRSS